MDVNVHIERVINNLQNYEFSNNVTIEKITRLENGNDRVKIVAAILFFDGSRLEFTEIVETGKCFPQIIRYSYQYLHEDREIFRYDNSPHHNDVPTFPDHKHVINNNQKLVVPSTRPSHASLFEEISKFISFNLTKLQI
jgi:hypothetical protein